MNLKLLFPLLLLVGLLSCGPQISDMEQKEMDQIEYRFSDSSTPPMYHRSYTITINAQQVECVVDVYGTELANETYPIDETRFRELVTKTSSLGRAVNKTTDGATGTKGYRISLSKKNTVFYWAYWDSLQEVNQGKLDFIEEVKAMVPNLSDLLARQINEDDN